MQSVAIFRRYEVVLCDVDGVVQRGPEAVRGVPEFLGALGPDGPRVFFLTNNGSVLPEKIVAGLGASGLDVPPGRLVTGGETLVQAFRDHGLVGAPVLSIGNEPAAEYVRRAGGQPIPPAEARGRGGEARAIVVGSTRDLDKDVLDAACNAVHRHGTPVFCTNPDTFAPGPGGELTLVAGAIANLLERELGAVVHRLGKPYRPIFDLALARVRAELGRVPAHVLVVDDNLESGIRGGAELGFDTLLVLSGWLGSRDALDDALERLQLRPTYVLPSVVS